LIGIVFAPGKAVNETCGCLSYFTGVKAAKPPAGYRTISRPVYSFIRNRLLLYAGFKNTDLIRKDIVLKY
jgi:hypothetical protein